jgi:hypothetical protein
MSRFVHSRTLRPAPVEERFRLRIRALARGDQTDCERLDRACPSLQYRDYRDRVECSDVLTLCVMVELLPKLAKLRMLGAVQPMVAYLEDDTTRSR